MNRITAGDLSNNYYKRNKSGGIELVARIRQEVRISQLKITFFSSNQLCSTIPATASESSFILKGFWMNP
jgi:hypothetical protein